MSEAKLNFEVEDCNGIRLIHVSGPLDSATYDQFKDYMDPVVRQSRARIVLDCQGLTYANSRGLTLLVHYQRTARQGFSFFGIAALSPGILKGIELLGLSKFVSWYPTLETALETAAAM